MACRNRVILIWRAIVVLDPPYAPSIAPPEHTIAVFHGAITNSPTTEGLSTWEIK